MADLKKLARARIAHSRLIGSLIGRECADRLTGMSL